MSETRIKLDLEKMTDEERIKFFEENFSPLIRYGFQEAINKMSI